MNAVVMAGAYAGIAAGAILTVLSHLAPFVGAGNVIRDLDEPRVFGKKITQREAHMIGILVHLLFSLTNGALFAWFVSLGWVSGFHLLPILGWSFACLLVQGGIVMPLEGHGFFGMKHDAWFPVDVFLTNMIWGFLYLFLIPLWTSV